MAEEQKKKEDEKEGEEEMGHHFDPDSDMCHTCGGCGPTEGE